jgi:hypothetical protein
MAPETNTVAIIRNSPVDIYETLLRAVMQVESKGDTLAYNPFEDAYGPLQIRPIRLMDFNIRTGKKYILKDCYRPAISKEIFMFYARLLGPDFELIAKRWNGSGEKTIEYWKKVKACLNNESKEQKIRMPS